MTWFVACRLAALAACIAYALHVAPAAGLLACLAGYVIGRTVVEVGGAARARPPEPCSDEE